MTGAQFKEMFKRVKDRWPNKISDSLEAEIFRVVQAMSAEDVQHIVDRVIVNCRYCPTPKDFSEAARAVGARVQQATPVSHHTNEYFHLRDNIYYSRGYVFDLSGKTYLRALMSEGTPSELEMECRQHTKNRPLSEQEFTQIRLDFFDEQRAQNGLGPLRSVSF